MTPSRRGPMPSSMARPMSTGVARLAPETRSSEKTATPLSHVYERRYTSALRSAPAPEGVFTHPPSRCFRLLRRRGHYGIPSGQTDGFTTGRVGNPRLHANRSNRGGRWLAWPLLRARLYSPALVLLRGAGP